MFEHEEWRVCVQAPDYMVSSVGRVSNSQGRIMSPDRSTRYHRYHLPNSHVGPSNPRKPFRIGVLMLSAFKGQKPSHAHHARHLDDNVDNNMLWNLAWGTPLQNGADRRGRRLKDRPHGWRQEVLRAVHLFGISKHVLAKMYHCDPGHIRLICKREKLYDIGQSI